VHAPRINLREHMAVLSERLTAVGVASFRTLCADCQETIEIVARFLGVLELFREGRVSFDQVVALGDLQVRWVPNPAPEEAASVEDHPGENQERGPA
jgi:segregation and condensation protein A